MLPPAPLKKRHTSQSGRDRKQHQQVARRAPTCAVGGHGVGGRDLEVQRGAVLLDGKSPCFFACCFSAQRQALAAELAPREAAKTIAT